jgi:hypothetical protein
MRRYLFAILPALALVSVVTLSDNFASAEITRSETFEASAKTSIKIPEPANAHVFVTVGKDVKDDSTPAIFNLPDADAYVTVKVVMADGETWSGKIEIKAKHQTVVRFTQSKKGGPAPSASAAVALPKYTGTLSNNTDTCDWPENVKFVVSQNGAQVFTSGLVFPGKQVTTTLEKGSYFVQILDTSGSPLGSKALTAGKDGWSFASGCVKN